MKNYINPVILNSQKDNTSDPYVVKHNGRYYHCYNSNEEGVFITESENLSEIGSGRKLQVYGADASDTLRRWYAPELHYINGKWYIYAAPDYGNDLHVMTILEHEGDTPMGEYKYAGMVKGLENEWSIDGTVFHHNGKMYFIWATGYEMKMSEMSDPYTITGERITVAKPEYDFETSGGAITEGPAVLKRGNKLFIVYSANESQCDDYCLGLLTCSADDDIMNPENWIKSKTPVFEKAEKIFGPGHCSFTTVTENGEEVDYIVYHANLERGTGWMGRSVFIQPFTWDENDNPVFGRPRF